MAHYDEHDADGVVLDGTAMEVMPPTAIALLNSSEIDQQMAYARKYPRSLTYFTKEVRGLVTLDPATAGSCIYAVPRAGKTIEGASIRFAEMVNYAWANTRVGTRIADIGDEFVTVEGLFFDLEKNSAVKSEVLRRITNRKGEKFDADMIQTTSAAAGAIARRNAILTGIPKTLWMPMYEDARRVVAGDVKTLANMRSDAIKAFAIFGILPAQIYGVLGVNGHEEITRDHLVLLAGIKTAIEEKTITPEDAFAPDKMKAPGSGGQAARPERSEFTGDKDKKVAGAQKETKAGDAKATVKPKADEKQTPAKDELKAHVDSLIASSVALASKDELDKLDDVVCDAITKAGRDEELRPAWNEAYKTAAARIEAANQPQETEEERKARAFKDWLGDQYKRLEAATTISDVDGMEDEAGNELSGDEAELAKWKAACQARVQAIRASRGRR